ncbi:hypothetical protein BU24DRAFT_91143 [Aaosphaeria arxii CBS 175.79]|uniref:Uncharacterized protein n=1 Tax=Aaosphaeria arxii CBS 175.79 TaxID=1450172 RepID=A0A6A5X876_9PLEO|nr:uncharacterized protein BU24DRAFT_91143 [Aaosphaeria arxii CBS 175.79]KAF2009130.1 hypothetical protein BU24DRAFT_91143 [Aaosphaeria arxii CBS 175.79]
MTVEIILNISCHRSKGLHMSKMCVYFNQESMNQLQRELGFISTCHSIETMPQYCPMTWTCRETDCNQTNLADKSVCQNPKCQHKKCAKCTAKETSIEVQLLLIHNCYAIRSSLTESWFCCVCYQANPVLYNDRDVCPNCSHVRCSLCSLVINELHLHQQSTESYQWALLFSL